MRWQPTKFQEEVECGCGGIDIYLPRFPFLRVWCLVWLLRYCSLRDRPRRRVRLGWVGLGCGNCEQKREWENGGKWREVESKAGFVFIVVNLARHTFFAVVCSAFQNSMGK